MTAWNKGKTISQEQKLQISKTMRGRSLSTTHKQNIAVAQKKRISKLKMCSACSVKSKWIYKVRMPFTEYPVLLCDTDLMDQIHSLSPENKKRVKILQ